MGKRATDFRWVFADTIGFTFSENDGRLIFGMAEEPRNAETACEQVGVVMTPRTLKALGTIVSATLDHYEKTTGSIIPIDEGFLAAFKARLDQPASDDSAI